MRERENFGGLCVCVCVCVVVVCLLFFVYVLVRLSMPILPLRFRPPYLDGTNLSTEEVGIVIHVLYLCTSRIEYLKHLPVPLGF